MDLEHQILCDLTTAANYLDLNSLLNLCCAKLASTIKGKTTQELRKQFNIVNDFTPQEEIEAIQDNQWAFKNN